MRETPLITFTKADDSGCGQRDPGDLDYIIHSEDLIRWLSNGSAEHGDDGVTTRSRALAEEMRRMADALEAGNGPVTVSVEYARKRYAERIREVMRRTNTTETQPA